MLKMALHVQIKGLSTSESKALLAIISKLERQGSNISQIEAFSFLNKKCQSELIIRKIELYL